jgi:hypothetical protein
MKKYIVFYLIIGISLVLNSCQDENEEISPEEDKEVLMDLSADIIEDIDQIADSEGVKGINSLMDVLVIHDPLFGNDLKSDGIDRYRTLLFPLPGKNRFKSASLEGFGFDQKAGTYSWNAENQIWDVQQGNPSDKIILNYPAAGSNSPVNNATFTLHEIKTQVFEDSWETWEQPTRLKADIYIDAVKKFDIDITVGYDTEGEPVEVDVYFMLSPFELDFSFEDSGSRYAVSGTLKADGTQLMSIDLKLNYVLETDEYWGYEEPVITNIEGFIQYGPLKLTGTVNIAALDEIENVTADDLNANVNLSLERFPGGQKIADITFIEETPGDPDSIEPILTFTDGSTELVKTYFKPVADALDAKLQEYFEGWLDEEN